MKTINLYKKYSRNLRTLSPIFDNHICYTIIINPQNFRLHYHQSIRRSMLTWIASSSELFSRPNRRISFASSYLRSHCRSFASQVGFMILVHVHDDTFRSYCWSSDLFSKNIHRTNQNSFPWNS